MTRRFTFILPGGPFGGVQAHTIQLACAIVAGGDNATIVTPDVALIRERTPDPRVRVLGPRQSSLAAIGACLGATLIGVRPDHRAMHIMQALAMRCAGRAACVIQHNAPSVEHADDPPRRFARLQHHLLTRVVCVSGAVRDSLAHRLRWPADLMLVRHNWTDAAKFRPDPVRRAEARRELDLPHDAWIVGTISRVNQQKRPMLMLEGFARFVRQAEANVPRVRDAHLLWIGDGPLRDPCVQRAEELGVSNRVHFVGPRDHPERWHPAFDLSLLTSAFEGFPLTMLECMACAVPMLATPAGGIAECIDDARTGFIHAMETPDDVASALAKVASIDDSAMSGIARRARATILERFTIPVAMGATLEALGAVRPAAHVRAGAQPTGSHGNARGALAP